MRDRAIVARLLCGSAAGALAAEPAVPMAQATSVPRAGISLAVPKGFAPQPLHEPNDVLRAALSRKGRPVQAVSLSAFAVGQKETADAFAEKMMAEATKSLVIRRLKVRKKTPMTVAGLPASARLLTYTYRDVETWAARVFFVRPVKGTKVRICYVLTVETASQERDKLLPVLGEVIKTVGLIAVKHPALVGVAGLSEAWVDAKRGVSIRPPRGWYATQTSVGVQMAVTDYLMGGVPALTATVAVADAPHGAGAEPCANRAIQRATKAAEGQNRTTTVLARGPASLGGVRGFQFVLRQVPKKARNGDLPVFIVHRIVCKPAPKAKKTTTYSLILICQGGSAKAAGDMLSKIATGFRFVAPPATQPATRPKPPAKGPARPAKPRE